MLIQFFFDLYSGSKTLKDAINEAMRDWVTNVSTTHYLIGSAIGPHPFPTIVREFQSVIGRESRAQFIEANGGKLPDMVMACVGGGSNAIGMFHPFVGDASVKIVGVEAGGDGVHTARHSATLTAGKPGVLHGTRTYLLQDQDGQIIETHSISAVCAFIYFLQFQLLIFVNDIFFMEFMYEGFGLSRCRPRTRMVERLGPRNLHSSNRRRVTQRRPPPLAIRRNHPSTRNSACDIQGV
jgi:hypothetical protein